MMDRRSTAEVLRDANLLSVEAEYQVEECGNGAVWVAAALLITFGICIGVMLGLWLGAV